ncbi:hypothetical protein ACFQZS_09540 [Mucilaginibacter calamicampi]|uniref:Uncharacterized protein n=1 Tax=Mucilaginibacter calamicampi TaxID=1302352 RepID=A0ABW2YVB3_9SPHI
MMLVNKITGRSLLDLIRSGYFDLIYPNFVSESVDAGLKKVEVFFGTKPNVYGSNIDAFKKIRDAIFVISKGSSIINSLNIAVPHTHWEGQNPVIYKFQEEFNRYVIGHHEPDVNKTYFPASFVFSEQEVLPYEWLEYNTNINEEEFSLIYAFLIELHQEVACNKWPLGINIDFRYKKTLFEESIPTVEIPLENEDLDGFAFIQKYADFILSSDGSDHTEQVAWSAISELSYKLNNDELNVLRSLRSKMSELKSDSEREKFLNTFLS